MTATTALARFTADDLARAPALLDAVLGELVTAGGRGSQGRPPEESPAAAALVPVLNAHRRRLVADYHASLARRIGDPGRPPRPGGPSIRGASAAPALAAPAPDDELAGLSLLDEAAVTADVETARLGDAIRAVADHELRELQALLAALAGDPQVSCNRLALDPQAHALALWEAACLLPDGPELAVALMRRAAQPLATALRRHWAAACTRLEDAGLVPAAYRTVVLHTALRTDLGAPTAPAEPTAATPDLAAAVARIFDALQVDRRIEPDFRPAIGRLREPALKAAAIDPSLVGTDGHPLWALVDRIAWQGRSLPPPPQRERVRTMQVVNGLVDALAREPRPDAERFRWALDRLLALERNRLERRIQQHAPQIASLTTVERQVAAPEELPPLDTDPPLAPETDSAQLPTVPADLVDAIAEGPAADAADAVWLDGLAVGEPIRLQVAGRWVLAQLMWRSPRGRLMLWASCTGDEAWPVHRTALHRLVLAGLAAPAAPDVLVGTIARPAGAPDNGRVCAA